MTAGRGSAQKRHARDSCLFSRFSACNCRPKMVCYEQIVKGDIAPLSEHNQFIIASQAPACQGVFAFSGDRPRFFCVLGGGKAGEAPCPGQKSSAPKSPFGALGKSVGKTLRVFPTVANAVLLRRFLLCREKGVRGIFRYLSCFFFLLRAAAPVAAPPLASTRTSHKERLLVSPVGGVFGSFAVTVSALAISLVPSLSL